MVEGASDVTKLSYAVLCPGPLWLRCRDLTDAVADPEQREMEQPLREDDDEENDQQQRSADAAAQPARERGEAARDPGFGPILRLLVVATGGTGDGWSEGGLLVGRRVSVGGACRVWEARRVRSAVKIEGVELHAKTTSSMIGMA